jgi:hypothetical protein
MRSGLTVFGSLLILVGAVWFLQGIGILPGSFMTGQTQWAAYGAAALVAGVFVVAFARRPPA